MIQVTTPINMVSIRSLLKRSLKSVSLQNTNGQANSLIHLPMIFHLTLQIHQKRIVISYHRSFIHMHLNKSQPRHKWFLTPTITSNSSSSSSHNGCPGTNKPMCKRILICSLRRTSEKKKRNRLEMSMTAWPEHRPNEVVAWDRMSKSEI